jgi:hypothetical protein
MENFGIFHIHLAFLRPLRVFYDHLVYFVVISSPLILVCCTKKNLATLIWTLKPRKHISTLMSPQITKILYLHKAYEEDLRHL